MLGLCELQTLARVYSSTTHYSLSDWAGLTAYVQWRVAFDGTTALSSLLSNLFSWPTLFSGLFLWQTATKGTANKSSLV